MALEVYEKLRKKGYLLAGELNDLAQRASVYYHMYEDSGGRNVFPLIAAHGALWASGYFRKGMLTGNILSLQFCASKGLRQEKLASLNLFADRFRDINRKVCAEAYALYYYTKIYRAAPESRAGFGFSPALIDALVACHHSYESRSAFSKDRRWNLFHEFFLWEQENIVVPLVEAAYQSFHWPVIKYLALRPRIDFAYFGCGNCLRFKDFSSKDERIEKGMKAYMRAEEVGLTWVAESLKRYGVLPKVFFKDTVSYYGNLERCCEARLGITIQPI
ncbi:hypothetical protein [Hahella sp. CCB-MM4]|uniref:hypothetical protein n=1 Tax=Hahella sp. (strain CCB-MM4) TaxID=1926491 RepID=UPI0011408816|nr:hypothetical protein [Hahella sp. CCB-MM4]